MKILLGLICIVPLWVILHVTSLLARSMAVVSAVCAAATIQLIFWTKSEKLITWAMQRFGTIDNMKEKK